MSFIFHYKRYKRKLKTPLKTSRGEWAYREGILIRLVDKKRKTAYAEIAPLEGFLNESLELAEQFCKKLGNRVALADIQSVPNSLPCCQFAFSCAIDELTNERLDTIVKPHHFKMCKLLPGDPIPSVSKYVKEGYTSFKWKIGINAIDKEIEKVEEICSYFPRGTFLRLDANGALSFKQAQRWLAKLDQISVELLEQPLRPDAIEPMIELSKNYQTAIALDESVTNCNQLEAVERVGWLGPVVIKPVVVGSRTKFLNWRKKTRLPLVYSSAFETSIGMESALKLIASDTKNRDAPIGFDTQKFFEDDTFNAYESDKELGLLKDAPKKFKELWASV